MVWDTEGERRDQRPRPAEGLLIKQVWSRRTRPQADTSSGRLMQPPEAQDEQIMKREVGRAEAWIKKEMRAEERGAREPCLDVVENNSPACGVTMGWFVVWRGGGEREGGGLEKKSCEMEREIMRVYLTCIA